MANGFASIGFVTNLKTYVEDIKALSGSYVDFSTMNAYLDAQWQNRRTNLLCLNQDRVRVEPGADNIQYILLDTGYTHKATGEPIYGGFFSEIGPTDLTDAKRKWKGVEIGTKAEIIERWGQSEHAQAAPTSLADIFVPDWGKLGEYLNRAVADMTGTNWQEYIAKAYQDACAANQFVAYRPEKASPIAYFSLKVSDHNGEPLWAYSVENKVTSARQNWFGLYIIPENEIITMLYRKHYYFLGDSNIIFEGPAYLTEFLKGVAQKAMRENWEWSKSGQQGGPSEYPILRNYIEHTYLKLCAEAEEGEQNKVIEYGGKVYFNSGLLDRRFNQIIFVADKTEVELDLPVLGKVSRTMLCNLTAYSHTEREIARNFRESELPQIARYFTHHSQVIFDASLDIHLNEMHIYEDGVSRDRLPKYREEYERLKDNPVEKELLMARIDRDFKSACDRAKLLAERNYKLAVPQYWRETGKIQFLLPIYLGEREEAEVPQCALALDYDDTGRTPYYRGATILTLDMAYNNARLISKPDVFWLNPVNED